MMKALYATFALTLAGCGGPSLQEPPPAPVVIPSQTQVQEGTAEPVAFPIKR